MSTQSVPNRTQNVYTISTQQYTECLHNQYPAVHRMSTQSVLNSTQNVHTRNLHIKIFPNKCGKITISYMHHWLKKSSKLPCFSYFALPPLDVTNLKKATIKERLCSVFGADRHRTAVQCAFSTHLYTQPQQSANIFRPRWTEAQTRSTVAPDRKDGPEFWLWKNISLPEYLAQCVNGNSAVWVSVKSFAKCTLHSC